MESLLLRNGLVIAQDDQRRVLAGCDVLIEGDKIVKVGRGLNARADETIDCSRKIVLPGLVNAHSHPAMSLLRSYNDDLPLHDWLEKNWAVEALFTPQDMRAGALLACAEMIRAGVTSFADMYFHMGEVAKATEQSGLRANLAYSMIDLEGEEKRRRELQESDRLVSDWHNKANGRITCSIAPHAPYTCSKELLQAAAERAEKRKLVLQIHLSETRTELFTILKKTGKRPAEYLDSLGLLSSRTLAAHGCWLSKQECALLGKRKASVAFNPVSNMKLATGGTCPVPELQAAGVNVCLGTDGPASNNSQDIWETMKTGALLVKNSRWDPALVPAGQALDLATRHGALALGISAGSISPGKLADIILLDANAPNLRPLHHPVAALVYAANAGNVTHTIVGGKVLMREREIESLDLGAVVAGAEKRAFSIADKVAGEKKPREKRMKE